MIENTTKAKKTLAFDPDYLTEPGAILQETIDGLGMTQKELAARTDYTTKHINWLVSGRARMTPEAAVRFERVTRVPARFWNNLETQYQDRKARLSDIAHADEERAWLAEIPVKELVKRGAIPSLANPAERLEATLSFFGVASVSAWRSGWSGRQIAFRKAADTADCSGGIAAWVRLAELAAEQVACAAYDAGRFREALQAIRRLTTTKPDEFVPAMIRRCTQAGVALVLIPEIPGSRVSGAARWLTSTKAMLAVNLRGKRNDKFWFTFFHEAGHILNDGRDEVFVDVDYADDPREQSANAFASEILIPAKHSDTLGTLKSKAAVRALAQRLGIHPAIIVGRLQHDGIIPHTHMHDLCEPLTWAGASAAESQCHESPAGLGRD